MKKDLLKYQAVKYRGISTSTISDHIDFPGLFPKRFGTGPRILLAFHGFGQDAQMFESWQCHFPEYTIYSFDLFFHGENEWYPPELTLYPKQWERMLHQFLAREQINKFSIAAFSLGGRLAISTLRLFSSQIQEVLLMAPDGIKPNFWYQLSTNFRSVRYLFRKSVENPFLFEKIHSWAEKKAWVNKSVLRLAKNQMGSAELRWRVYATWMTYRKLGMSPSVVQKVVKNAKVPVLLFGGKHDRLIPPHILEEFSKNIPYIQYIEVPTGHFGVPSWVGECRELWESERKNLNPSHANY